MVQRGSQLPAAGGGVASQVEPAVNLTYAGHSQQRSHLEPRHQVLEDSGVSIGVPCDPIMVGQREWFGSGFRNLKEASQVEASQPLDASPGAGS
jgi:hypothetical protein